MTLIPGVEGENPHIELKEFEIVCKPFQYLNCNVFSILNQFKVLVVSLTTSYLHFGFVSLGHSLIQLSGLTCWNPWCNWPLGSGCLTNELISTKNSLWHKLVASLLATHCWINAWNQFNFDGEVRVHVSRFHFILLFIRFRHFICIV